jgi:hypothetical protein
MAYPYAPNSPIWSSEDHSPYYGTAKQYTSLAVGVGVMGAGLYAAAQKDIGKNKTAFDLLQSHARFASEASPLSMFNTFRVAEFMSPYISPAAKGLDKVGDQYIYNIESQFLKTEETKALLKHEYGADAFKKAGIDIEIGGDFELQYRQQEGKSSGSLFGRTINKSLSGEKTQKQEFQLIAEGLHLFEKTPFSVIEEGISVSKIKTMNPALFSALQASGLAEEFGPKAAQKADRVFGEFGVGNDFIGGKRFVPLKLPATKIAGSFGAFGMQRFNRLLQDVFEQIPIFGDIAGGLGRSVGLNTGVQPGTAPKMFARYGGAALKAGVAITGIAQIDWARRNYGLPGEVVASGALSIGAAALTQRVMKSGTPRAAFAVGVSSFFGQMILPGFDEGVIQGIATTATNAHIGMSALGAVTMMNTYRRTVEGFLPGVSSMEVGALAGIGAVGLSLANRKIFDRLEPETLAKMGLRGKILSSTSEDLTKSLNQVKGTLLRDEIIQTIDKLEKDPDTYLAKMHKEGVIDLEKYLIDTNNKSYRDFGRIGRARLYSKLYQNVYNKKGLSGVDSLLRDLHKRFEKSIQAHRELIRSNNPINASYAERLQEIDAKYQYGTDLTFGQKASRRGEKFFATLSHSFFGSSLMSDNIDDVRKATGYKAKLGKYGTIFTAGLLAQQLVTGGLLGSMEDPSELSAVYKGRKKVAVRKGRWWEGGGTPFEGGQIDYYRPHAYVELMTRSRQKASWGRNEDEISPIRKFFLKNFTYYIEETNYHNRPYPITGAAFEDIPVIGGLLSATLGRLIKPPKLMHTSEYMRMGEDGNIEFMHRSQPGDPSAPLGGKTPGTPTSPFSSRFVAGQAQYQFRELEGLTGFAKNVVQQSLTGTQTFETQRPVMGSAGQITDPGEQFWDLALGGGLFTTEAIRRFLPRKQSEIEEYNPLQNTMPYWMPDRFKYGDPYRRVKQGYTRMPGAGFEAIHPELEGFSMEEYPDIYKYSILADVAPMSKEFRQAREKMYMRRSEGITTTSENALMDSVDMLYNKKLSGIKTDHVHQNAIEIGMLSSGTQAVYAGAQEAFRKGVAPAEYMIPAGFRPVQKLLSDRDMIEQYEYERLYGNQFAFWDKPFRDWFRPAFYSAANMMGFEGKPLWRREVDKTQSYFDRLEFQKQMMLAQNAGEFGDSQAQRKHLINANKTRYGINPQSSAMSIYMSLPESEKKFFDAFSSTTSEKERKRILQMVPRDHKELYQAVWERSDAGDPTLYVGSVADYDTQYMAKRFYGLQSGGLGGPQPEVDWIGWRDDVELEDVQLKYLDSIGKDIHDYGFWESQRKDLARKEYLEGSEEFLERPTGLSPFGAAGTLYQASRLGANQRLPMESSAFLLEGSMQGGYGQMYYNDDRSADIYSYVHGMMNDVR